MDSVHMEARRYSVGVARNASKRPTHAQRHHARQMAREGEVYRDSYRGHPLGFPRSSEPVQAWAKSASRVAYHKARKRIPQRGKVVTME